MTTSSEYMQAMQVLEDLKKDYLNWVQDDLKKLNTAFAQAESALQTERTTLIREDLFRTAHDMKGQGSTFGYDLVTFIGNHLCRYIEKQTSFEEKQMQNIKLHIDAINQVINEHLTEDGGQQGQNLQKQIEAIV